MIATSILLNLSVALGAAPNRLRILDHPATEASLHRLPMGSEEDLSMDSALKRSLFLESLKNIGVVDELLQGISGNDCPAEEAGAKDAFLLLHSEAQGMVIITLQPRDRVMELVTIVNLRQRMLSEAVMAMAMLASQFNQATSFLLAQEWRKADGTLVLGSLNRHTLSENISDALSWLLLELNAILIAIVLT
jgi:hypothetical protein